MAQELVYKGYEGVFAHGLQASKHSGEYLDVAGRQGFSQTSHGLNANLICSSVPAAAMRSLRFGQDMQDFVQF